MNNLEHILAGLPDPTAAQRFLETFSSARPADSAKLFRNNGLLSDVLTLTAYSPLLAATLLQNPEHISWLDRKRRGPAIRTKEELLEALGRFVLTHSQLDLHAQLARFRRRELLRIFLSDIRRLTTIAEITEDISNLADAILETALRKAEQDTNNRFGPPLAVDKKAAKQPLNSASSALESWDRGSLIIRPTSISFSSIRLKARLPGQVRKVP
jgi:glutamate-ammonia-ligase adenylyltransferase